MNCRPGDLAVVMRPRTGVFCEWTGLIVEVIEPLQDIQNYPDIGMVSHQYKAESGEWLCRQIGAGKDAIFSRGKIILTSYGRMWDSRLKPIRDPGDDAVDEVIQRLGSPNKQEQTA